MSAVLHLLCGIFDPFKVRGGVVMVIGKREVLMGSVYLSLNGLKKRSVVSGPADQETGCHSAADQPGLAHKTIFGNMLPS
ncbi:MAG: Uncharacterised protein [Cryomorphaceae bacterium]|nr:MAG: Uncharacterised protein [Cryomorphaceae bacterium]